MDLGALTFDGRPHRWFTMPSNVLYAPYAHLVLAELSRLPEENPPENDRYVSAER
jgi:hypothetical protein